MRYDPQKQRYQDCKWCQGRGCLACSGEAKKDFEASQPQLIATFTNEEINLPAVKKAIGPTAIMDAKAEGRIHARALCRHVRATSLFTYQEIERIAADIAGTLIAQRIVAVREQLGK